MFGAKLLTIKNEWEALCGELNHLTNQAFVLCLLCVCVMSTHVPHRMPYLCKGCTIDALQHNGLVAKQKCVCVCTCVCGNMAEKQGFAKSAWKWLPLKTAKSEVTGWQNPSPKEKTKTTTTSILLNIVPILMVSVPILMVSVPILMVSMYLVWTHISTRMTVAPKVAVSASNDVLILSSLIV